MIVVGSTLFFQTFGVRESDEKELIRERGM